MTTTGPVRGLTTGHGTTFFGVPYAAAPTGSLRFAAPHPHPKWTAVRDATRPGPTAPQAPRGAFGTLDMSPYFGPGWRQGADYLTADIWCPNTTAAPAPVMVFVHGGGFVAGSASAHMYDGSAFARDGVVLVVLNYRLGIPGFLHLPDAPDNRGMLDVIAALRWLQTNIAGFGGDPTNVTLFGQSAGAIVVGAVLAAPEAHGLMRRAIIQSGSGIAAFTTEQAQLVTDAAARELGIPATARAWEKVPDACLVDVVSGLATIDLRTATHHDPLGGITKLGLVLDQQPVTAIAAGAGGDVDLLIGSNRDEGSLYLAPLGLLPTTTDADVLATSALFTSRPDDLVQAYRDENPNASAAALRVAVLSDGLFGIGTRRLAAAHAAAATAGTFVYEFVWRSDALNGNLGASHVMELPFVFDRLALPALSGPTGLVGSAPPVELATRMHSAWVQFASTGNPGWAPFGSNIRVQEIGDVWQLTDGIRGLERDAWIRNTTTV
jgi:para-nitrobenzyl esterase